MGKKVAYTGAREETVPYKVRITGDKSLTTTQRSAWLAKLFDSLSEDEREAMKEIDFVFRYLTGRAGGHIMMYEPDYQPGTNKNDTRNSDLVKDYFDWAGRPEKRPNFHHAAVLDIVHFGKTMRECDRSRHKYHGWARRNLGKALHEYCIVKGWRRPTY
ncbi:MAG: hypothetical protein NXI13_16355 [Proteobacteria bacterium]|nr:hypothetical protein [Pseudomonadota bacterium]